MTPQEQQLLGDLLNRISQIQPAPRDPEADAMIQRALGARPDALYLLTQMALMNDITIKHAEQQIRDLQQRAIAQPASQPASFLGSGGPWGKPANVNTVQQPYQPQQAYAQAGFTQQAAPSFLHNVLATASGVVAGEMAFSAIHSLFGGGMGGMGGNSFLSGASAPATETTVNNYYGDSNPSSDNSYDSASYDDSSTDFSTDDSI